MGGYRPLQAAGLGFTPGLGARVSSSYCKPKHFAGFLDLTLPPALALTLWSPQRLLRLLTAALTLVLLANAVLGFSRGAWGTLRFAPDLAARRASRQSPRTTRLRRCADRCGEKPIGEFRTPRRCPDGPSHGHPAAPGVSGRSAPPATATRNEHDEPRGPVHQLSARDDSSSLGSRHTTRSPWRWSFTVISTSPSAAGSRQLVA